MVCKYYENLFYILYFNNIKRILFKIKKILLNKKMNFTNNSFTFKDIVELKQEINVLTRKYKYNNISFGPN